uniref:CSON011063 protein n=1 Tax=Culicoides sonorensis TaxID=179676 RepID=A0A336LKW8_CULSO
MAERKTTRRPIINEDSLLIDSDILNTSNGQRIADWIKLRQEFPVKRGRLFDLDAIKKNPPRLSIRRLAINNEENANEDSSSDDNEEEECEPVPSDAQPTEQNQEANVSLFSKTLKKLKDLTSNNAKTQEKPKDLPAKTSLSRRVLTKQTDQPFDEVASTPLVGHRVQLNSSVSPITVHGIKRLSVLKPEVVNQLVGNEQNDINVSPSKKLKSPRKKQTQNQVVVLNQIVIPPETAPSVTEPYISPVGIVSSTNQMRPKNLSNIIEANQQNMSSPNIPSMIPERNENFDSCSSSGHTDIMTSLSNNDQNCSINRMQEKNNVPENEEVIPETQEHQRDEEDAIFETEHNQSEEIIPETQKDQSKEIIPETQEDQQVNASRRIERRTSSSSSCSSNMLLYFNESLLPTNEMTSRSPYGPPLLRTILRDMNRDTSERRQTIVSSNVKSKKGKKSSINLAAKTYLELNNSDEESSRRHSKIQSIKSKNSTKRTLYSERFDDIEAGPETENNRTPQNEPAQSSKVSENARITRNSSKNLSNTSENEIQDENRHSNKSPKKSSTVTKRNSDVIKMPPPPAPVQRRRGRPKKKKTQASETYITPEITSNKTKSVVVYEDSDHASNDGKTKKLPKNIQQLIDEADIVDSCDFQNGVRKSKRQKYLKVDKPNAKICTTTEEFDNIFKRLLKPHETVAPKKINVAFKTKKKKPGLGSESGFSTASSKPRKTKDKIANNADKEILPAIDENAENVDQNNRSQSKRANSKTSTQQNAGNDDLQILSDLDNEPLPVRNNSNLNGAQFKVPNIPKQKRARPANHQVDSHDIQATMPQTDFSHDSGLQSVSESSNTANQQSQTISKQVIEPVADVEEQRNLSQESSVSRSTSQIQWISNLMRPDKDHLPFYESDFDELASCEEIRFVDHGGVQYACYMGDLFNNCGYMRIDGHTTKKRGKAIKYDLRFLVIKASDLEVTVGDNKIMKPKEGFMFFVKKGTSYSIKNQSRSRALLHFTRTP